MELRAKAKSLLPSSVIKQPESLQTHKPIHITGSLKELFSAVNNIRENCFLHIIKQSLSKGVGELEMTVNLCFVDAHLCYS